MGYKISVSGDLGSGKTSVSKALAERLGFNYLSTGTIHREMAAQMGLDALELNRRAESDEEVDRRIDAHLVALAHDERDFVIDSRVAWHFVPQSLKVYLKVDADVAAERVISDLTRTNEPVYADRAEARKRLLERVESERKRYLDKYHVDRSDLRNYDVVIDTTLLTRDQVFDQLRTLVLRWQSGQDFQRYWASPKLLYPTEHVRDLTRNGAERIREDVRRAGFDATLPIDVSEWRGFLFIWDGHIRTSAALFAGIPAVPIRILARDGEELPDKSTAGEFARASMERSRYYDWEDAHQFRFLKYPQDAQSITSPHEDQP